jgi:hypothetical protein
MCVLYRVMGSRDPSQSVGPSDASPLSVPEAELIIKGQESQDSMGNKGDFPSHLFKV